ncbi:MAG: SOS response-associated peptidase [Lentimicrobiaceae bacterium]|nr:SOS response-associated peptidase [Lentimicrobiaceae bacterium]
MCGRFSLTSDEHQLNLAFELSGGVAPYTPRYNSAPTQQLAVIPNDDPRHLHFYRWGLIPFWSKDLPKSKPIINARAETLGEKVMFKKILKSRRCLIPADGFYEWKRNGNKIPYRFVMKNGKPFAMAGLWDEWKDAEGKSMRSFTIITTGPNELMKPIHDRMPLILKPEHYALWLDESITEIPDEVLLPYPAEEMEMYRVSDKVNSVRNDNDSIIVPVKSNELF